MDLNFNDREKLAFLEKNDLKVFKKVEKMWVGQSGLTKENWYSNEVIFAVTKNGKEFARPPYSSFKKHDWINNAFNALMKERLLSL